MKQLNRHSVTVKQSVLPLAADKALSAYLDAMLHEATQPEATPEVISPKTIASPKTAEQVDIEVADKPTAYAELAAQEIHHRESRQKVEVSPAEPATLGPIEKKSISATNPVIKPNQQKQSQDESSSSDISDWLQNGRPAWAQERFDCLVFIVDGLKLAVPLLLLGNIYPLDRSLTPLFDQPEWFLGLLPVQQSKNNIRVVNTALLVMPERYRAESILDYAYVISVHGFDWAFACHKIEGSITLEPNDVKWRTTRTRRPWLAGTVIDQMCALLDLNAFARTLLN